MTDAPAHHPPALDDLIAVLTLEELGVAHFSVTGLRDQDAVSSIGAPSARVFEGQSQKMPYGRVFGGQVLAQCVMAAGRTVAPADGGAARPIHSLHGYFMRPGDDTRPIRFAVEEMRDGASFSTRRVHAVQHEAPIMSMSCSFQERADGLEHQDTMPDVPGPGGLRSLAEEFAHSDDPGARHIAEHRPIEQRHLGRHLYVEPDAEHVAEQFVWMRAIGHLPDDPLLHAAVLAYASDYTLLEPVLRRHGLVWTDPRLRAASLDHAMWFHRHVDPSDWILYALRSPSATSGRGLGIGRMFSRDGTLVASVAQEGMLRLKQS